MIYKEVGKTLYFYIETFIGKKKLDLQILKSSWIKQRSKSHVAAQLQENVIRIYSKKRISIIRSLYIRPISRDIIINRIR